MDYVAMGKRVRTRRKELGLKQEELAARVGISASFFGHIERGSRVASIETLVSMANALNTSADYLLGTNHKEIIEIIDNGLTEQERKVAIAALDSILDALRK